MEIQRSNPLVWLGLALALAVGLMALITALLGGAWGMGYGMMGVGWGWGMGLLMVVPVVLLILVLLAALGESVPHRSTTPLETLEERYARGEISRDEYTRMRNDLEAHR